MIQLVLYPQQNRVHVIQTHAAEVSKEVPYQFQRRWECQILSMLLVEGQVGQALNADTLQQTLRQKGQPKNLNRAQLQRLFGCLTVFLTDLPGQPLILKIAPRQSTVGPWMLFFSTQIIFHNAEIVASAKSDEVQWQYPRLLAVTSQTGAELKEVCVNTLHLLLSELLNSDAFALKGEYREAINILQHFDTSLLTEEAQALILLRESVWQKRLGYFENARQLVQKVMECAPKLDPGITNYAGFLLQRIDYDESPAQAHPALWHSSTPPQMALQSDWRLMPEWHNLRALLARRRLLALNQSIGYSKNNKNIVLEETPVSLNQYALKHFQSAIYWALQQRDWDRLQAYVCNLAFHLQEMLPLGFVTVNQVFNWHRLILSYTDKLNLAQDSAWEFIFFGEFWLNHHAEISDNSQAYSLSNLIEDLTPSQEDFYLLGLEKLNNCADDRQIAIMWILYGRFAMYHMGARDTCDSSLVIALLDFQKMFTLRLVEEAITELLHKNPNLQQTLFNEGYADYLPRA